MDTINRDFKLDTPIHKFFPLRYLSKLLKGELRIGKVSSWEDVYENFMLKQNYIYENQYAPSAKKIIDLIFGQSWTDSEETDAMWRIYSDINHGSLNDPFINAAVRIKTTGKKIKEAISSCEKYEAIAYIRKVKYKTLNEIYDWLSRLNLSLVDCSLTNAMADSLFIKRKEFEHESEVRIVFAFSNNKLDVTIPKFLSFSINPDDFIEEYLLDPRLDSEDAELIKKRMVEAGADADKIKLSKLYQFTPYPKPLIIH